MKKKLIHKLIIILIISNLFIYNSFAEGSCESGCKIKNGTPDIIFEYISNNDKVIQNITSNLGKANTNKNIPTDVSQNGTTTNINNSFSTGIGLRIYNSLFNWSEAESGFKYFLANIDGDIPYPIKRDLELIDRQNQKLNYFLSKVIKSGQSSGIIKAKKVCSGIEDNGKCLKLVGKNIEENLKNLIDNNNTINLILRKELGFMGFSSLVGSNSYEEIFLIPDNFKSQIKQNYNKETYKSCANCKGGSIERVKKSIKGISKNFSSGNKGIQEWIDAWNLLLGINDKDNNKEYTTEKRVLQEELARQGISTNNGQAVLEDLKNFQGNDFGFSIGNNPISNSFLNLIEEIKEPFKSTPVSRFTETIANINDNLPDRNSFNFDDIVYSEKNLGNDSEIVKRIQKTISQNRGIVAKQNKSTDKLQGRIITLHKNLVDTINQIQKIIIKTEKICNDQDTKNGKCSYR